jgi:hypothetical protein
MVLREGFERCVRRLKGMMDGGKSRDLEKVRRCGVWLEVDGGQVREEA